MKAFQQSWALGLIHTLMQIRVAWLLLAIAAATAGCHVGRESDATPPISWHIVDSAWVTPWDEVTDSAAVYRLAVVGPSRTDTLTDILPPWPVIVDDSAVWGFRKIREGTNREFFRWSVPARNIVTLALPADVLSGYNDIMISPRGRFVAYVGKEDTGGAYGVVRELESRRLLWRGPTASGCDCDVDLSHARWVTADSFEIAVVSTSNGRGWAISAGSATSGRAQLLYSPTEPDWHSASRP